MEEEGGGGLLVFIVFSVFVAAMFIVGPFKGCEFKCPSNDPEMQSYMKYTITVGSSFNVSGGGLGVGTGGVGVFGGDGEIKPTEKFYTSEYHITPQGGIEFSAYNWREGTSTRVFISGGYTVRETDFAHFNYLED